MLDVSRPRRRSRRRSPLLSCDPGTTTPLQLLDATWWWQGAWRQVDSSSMFVTQAADARQLSTLGSARRAAAGTPPRIQREGIDDHHRCRDAEPAQTGEESFGFEARQLRGAGHDDE